MSDLHEPPPEWEQKAAQAEQRRVLAAFGFLHHMELPDGCVPVILMLDVVPCPWCARPVRLSVHHELVPFADGTAMNVQVALHHERQEEEPCPYFISVRHNLPLLKGWPTHDAPGVLPEPVGILGA